ncbi:alpha/beta hydrolase [Corallococcus sp. AB049A]|uniref:Alpha/beta hydrolase n=1 Tax=Corallococcus interemptor TaxID=2316720 RepID=A0A3A8QMK9_9BACT|nr:MULTISPECIES: alpha/beta hydrolase [Corallococcus]RKH48650.1 alpha/beta hydrolase [Corallococcus sp. AB050B]RKH69747.1 alpha/beta hydrolase [Corallococcus interemptor]RKI61409.1 alpha/beta hydrolase [Corallococcus sp. AB049A]
MTRQQPSTDRPFFPRGFREGDEDVNGTRIHFVIGGQGSPVLLLHGYTQTHLMWWRLAPELAKQHTVLIPDLRGAGASAAPVRGYDKETMARDMRALVKRLCFEKVSVVGHDIGLMVAYAYAALFPNEVERLALLDAFLPGIEPWSDQVMSSRDVWHFTFNGPTAEKLVQGRERVYFDHFWTDLSANPDAVGEAERRAYTEAYAAPGRLHSTWGYFQAFEQDKKAFRELARNKLPMPVMVIGGDKSLGEPLAAQARAVATQVEPHILQDTGHWVAEERPEEVRELLGDFLRA